MHTPTEYDPDDNFARAFDAEADIDEDAAIEALAWQLLLLINPGDEDAAMQQFGACRDALDEGGDPQHVIRDVIDWKSGFHVDEDDVSGLIEVLDELAARYDLRIDWGVDDPGDEDFLSDAEVPALINTAFADELRAVEALHDRMRLEPQDYTLADGRVVRCERYLVQNVTIGGFTVANVTLAVLPEAEGQFLLGKSFLDKFTEWRIDARTAKLHLKRG